jgi:putative phage-type endonuclease
MTAIVHLEQGSAEWLAHRQKYRNASETPAVMRKSPWVTPYQLWELRTSRREQEVNYAMRRGAELEPATRAAYEAPTGHVMQPMVTVDGDYSASLDGITFDCSLIVEIKCPLRGATSTLWEEFSQGELPKHYRLQVQHQLMVSGAERAELYVYDADIDDGVITAISPEPTIFEAIRASWDAFMVYIETDTPPELTERDKQVRTDKAWVEAAARYASWKAVQAAADTTAPLLLLDSKDQRGTL